MSRETKNPGEHSSSDAAQKPNASAGDPVSEILKTSRTVAVVDLLNRKFRPSHGLAQYMQSAGYRIIPLNPNKTEVFGEKSYAKLEDVPDRIDIVDIVRRPEFVLEIVQSEIRINARAIWMQEGVIHPQAAEQAAAQHCW
jgi:uncharacterized protein